MFSLCCYALFCVVSRVLVMCDYMCLLDGVSGVVVCICFDMLLVCVCSRVLKYVCMSARCVLAVVRL